jgi:serine/threonine protein kinase
MAHNDLKPENILIDENMLPVIADLGFSNRVHEPLQRCMGTYPYMAPELFALDDFINSSLSTTEPLP